MTTFKTTRGCILGISLALVLAACSSSASTPAPAATGTTAPAATGTTAPAGTAPAACTKTIGATLLSLQYPFLVTLNDAMKAEAAKEGVCFDSLDPRQKVDTELSQVEDLITKKVDLMIMVPVDVTQSGAAAKKINGAGIPLMFVNTKLDASFASGGGKVVTYVGSDDVKAGEIQGQYVVDTLGSGGGKIIYLVGQYGGASTNLRKQGFTEILSKHPEISIATELEGHGSRAEGKTIMEDLLQKYSTGQISAVICQNDEMALGALSAIQAAGRRSEFKAIMGLDGEAEALTSISSGCFTATVFQDAVAQGTGAIQTAVKILNGQTVDPLIDIPFKLVTKDNVAQFK
jgi:ABC-type sugar transport system substrate-binding protein